VQRWFEYVQLHLFGPIGDEDNSRRHFDLSRVYEDRIQVLVQVRKRDYSRFGWPKMADNQVSYRTRSGANLACIVQGIGLGPTLPNVLFTL